MIKNSDLNCEINTGQINTLRHVPKICNLDLSNAPKNAKNGDEDSEALLPLSSNFAIYSLNTPRFYINRWHLHIYYLGNLYHQITLNSPIPTHFKLHLSDQNYQRYTTSPFSSLKSSYFTSSQQSQECYFLDDCSYGDLVLLLIPIK